jgi:hypothetical protein
VNTWVRVGCAGSILAALMVLRTTSPAPAETGLAGALDWLQSQQQPDGGFSNGVSAGSDPGTTADVVLAAAVAGDAPGSWKAGGQSPIDYLEAHASSFDPADAGRVAKLVLAVRAAGLDPRAFAGSDWVDQLSAGWEASRQSYAGDPYSDALVILALHAAGGSIEPEAAAGLEQARLADGTYAFNGDTTPGAGDSNTTAMIVQALVALGEPEAAIQPSLAYFRSAQNADGGWTYQKPSPYGEETDANSTALVVQALLAAGEELGAWRHPEQTLLGLQHASGALTFNAATPGDNLLATAQGIPALAGVALSNLPGPPERSSNVGSHLPLIGVVLEILVLLLVGAAIAYRQSKRE